MKTLYESLLSKTENKVKGAKNSILLHGLTDKSILDHKEYEQQLYDKVVELSKEPIKHPFLLKDKKIYILFITRKCGRHHGGYGWGWFIGKISKDEYPDGDFIDVVGTYSPYSPQRWDRYNRPNIFKVMREGDTVYELPKEFESLYYELLERYPLQKKETNKPKKRLCLR